MPIQLTTAYNIGCLESADPPGGASSVTSCTVAKILEFKMQPEAKRIELAVQLGNVVESVWAPVIGIEGKTSKQFIIEDPDYSTLVTSQSVGPGEVYYDKVAEKLYQWLIDHSYFVGTIV